MEEEAGWCGDGVAAGGVGWPGDGCFRADRSVGDDRVPVGMLITAECADRWCGGVLDPIWGW